MHHFMQGVAWPCLTINAACFHIRLFIAPAGRRIARRFHTAASALILRVPTIIFARRFFRWLFSRGLLIRKPAAGIDDRRTNHCAESIARAGIVELGNLGRGQSHVPDTDFVDLADDS